jgi:hypothetical protein
MPTDPQNDSKAQTPPTENRRRAEHERQKNETSKEQGGRGGLDPTRYGDWEKDGLASDF